MAMFLFQWLLLLCLFFAIICVLFDVINQGIHLDVILTLAKFFPTSAMVSKQHGLRDSIYFERKKTRDFCYEIYIFGFSIYQV